jgi:hypothetical protein
MNKRLLPFLFTLLFACTNKEEKKSEEDTRVTIADSSTMAKPDRTGNPYAGVDVSPMDMSYYPADYPKLKMSNAIKTLPFARVIYSRPHLQGRHVFHEVLKYDLPWRLGANESTELQLYSDALIQDKKIKAGRYILYCLPQKDKWIIVLNSGVDSWGLEQNPALDIAHFTIPIKETKNSLEYFTIVFEKKEPGAEIIFAWDNIEARLPISF